MSIIKTLFITTLLTSSISMQDFKDNESYYQELCQYKSNFQANESICSAYQDMLDQNQASIENNINDLKSKIESNSKDINHLTQAIKDIEVLLNSIEKEMVTTKESIKVLQQQIITLEDEVKDRLSLAQEVSNDNLVIDFIMSVSSLDDFFLKLEGYNALTKASNTIMDDLNDKYEQLETKKNQLLEKEIESNKYKVEQERLLKEYRENEVQLYKDLEQARKEQIKASGKASAINLDDVVIEEPEEEKPVDNNNGGNNNNTDKPKPDKSFMVPVSSYVITAETWYYPASFGGGWHPGLDLANNTGTPILSPNDGIILLATSEFGGYGNYMVTAHQVGNDTYTFIYGHLSGFIQTSGKINKGQQIALMGSTGNSTGPHLHLEVFVHKNRSLQEVVNDFQSNYDIYFGLGYTSINGSRASRLAPRAFFGI